MNAEFTSLRVGDKVRLRYDRAKGFSSVSGYVRAVSADRSTVTIMGQNYGVVGCTSVTVIEAAPRVTKVGVGLVVAELEVEARLADPSMRATLTRAAEMLKAQDDAHQRQLTIIEDTINSLFRHRAGADLIQAINAGLAADIDPAPDGARVADAETAERR